MPAMEIPISAIGIRGIEIFDKVVAFAQEEVVGEHYADETPHEYPHAGDAGEEYGA